MSAADLTPTEPSSVGLSSPPGRAGVPLAGDVVLDAPERLAPFNRAGVLAAGDVHVARRLAALVGEDDPEVVLAAALAVRAPGHGSTCVDLAVVADHVVAEEHGDAELLAALEWPAPDPLVRRLAASALVAEGPVPGPLALHGQRLYLRRLWDDEQALAAAFTSRRARLASTPLPLQRGPLAGLHPGQARAVDTVTQRDLTVIAGGPGTGKTTTIARLVIAAHLARPDLRVALAAPTGKAAARLGEALVGEARSLGLPTVEETEPGGEDEGPSTQPLPGVEATTIHRLLGLRPGGGRRPRHDRRNPVAADLVIVDEASMVSVALMRHVVDAVADTSRLVLVGDPDQLQSVEAGSVLGDLIGDRDHPAVVRLTEGHRFTADSGVGRFALAISGGDVDAALDALRDPIQADVSLVVPDDADGWPRPDGALEAVCERLRATAAAVRRRAAAGDAAGALAAANRLKVLCAHRRGPAGVATYNALVERLVDPRPPHRRGAVTVGQPVMIGHNDRLLGVYNGDLGVVVASGGRPVVAVDSGRGLRHVDVVRLPGVQTVHALTIHKSQGSEFGDVIVVLPVDHSPILTRELLYTAITRARASVTVIGSEQSVRTAVERRLQRTGGLREALAS
ncbi:MAG: exodeoxyribonuclease V subunit alpha [Actinobacteria bacterium]|nr:exodeoxyribonuclease V subunit alpha [Actinomycetota bacterium]